MVKKATDKALKNKLVISMIAITAAAVILLIVTLAGCLATNSAPIILNLEANREQLATGESSIIRVQAGDPDGDGLVFSWSAAAGDILGQGSQVDWIAPAAQGDYSIAVSVSDDRGAVTTQTLVMEVVPNEAPVIEGLSARRGRINRGETVVLECAASDADGDELAYEWSVPDGVIFGSGPMVAWQAPVELGSYEIHVEVGDGRGGRAVGLAVVDVTVNHAPEIDSLVAAETTVLYGQTTTVTCMAVDPDGDPLSYRWVAEEGEITGSGSVIEWLATSDCGESPVVSVSVFDDRGGETSYGISIRTSKPG